MALTNNNIEIIKAVANNDIHTARKAALASLEGGHFKKECLGGELLSEDADRQRQRSNVDLNLLKDSSIYGINTSKTKRSRLYRGNSQYIIMNYHRRQYRKRFQQYQSGIVRHVHGATTPSGKPFGILEKVIRCACCAWELTPCIFYTPQALGLLDSWCNSIYTVFKVPICLF